MQKITPFLWFDTQAEEAMNFFTANFKNAQITAIQRYPGTSLESQILSGVFELMGQQFMALNGGPAFKFTPAVSFFVNCATNEEIDQLWERLSDGGTVLMDFQEYQFSEKFGWLEDKYGLSWQLNLGVRAQKITPFLMFVGKQHGKAEEAIHFYTSLFENSSIGNIKRYAADGYGETGMIEHAVFYLNGQEFMALESNLEHSFTFTEAISFYVECESQDEVDYFWNTLSDDPKAEQCGWLKDKYGLSWQIIPTVLRELLHDSDPEKSSNVMNAILQMKKINIEGLKRAYER